MKNNGHHSTPQFALLPKCPTGIQGLDEITGWVLSWGGQAEVVGPAELRANVRAAAARMRDRHG